MTTPGATEADADLSELREAQAALMASLAALRTHGHQGISWSLYRADAERVSTLKRRLNLED